MKVIAKIGILGICASLLIGSVGCHLCCAPYDYCGPVYENGQCSDLSRVRCGSVTAINACSTCNKDAEAATQNQDPTAAPTPAAEPTPAPAPAPAQNPTVIPAPAPNTKSVGPQVYRGMTPNVRQVQAIQPMNQANSQVMAAAAVQPVNPARSLVVGTPASQKAQAQTLAMDAPAAQSAPVAAAVGSQVNPQPVEISNDQAAKIPSEGVIAVGPDGLQKVEVYDDKGQFLGYETIDGTGKTVQALDLSKLPQPQTK